MKSPLSSILFVATFASMSIKGVPMPLMDTSEVMVPSTGTHFDNEVVPISTQYAPVKSHHRQPRAVNLGRLRRLVNNVALSEYYRIRGLEVMDSLGVNYDQDTSASTNSNTNANSNLTVLQSRILNRLRDAYRRDKTMQNIFTYLQD